MGLACPPTLFIQIALLDNKFKGYIMEMGSKYNVKIREIESHFESRIKEIHSEHSAYIREMNSDYLYKKSMMQITFSESVNAIAELQLRKANILCESKNKNESTLTEIERIDSAIKTLDELSELSFKLKRYSFDHIHNIELEVKALKDIIINSIYEINDDKTKFIIIKFLTKDTNDIGSKLNSSSFPGNSIQNEEKIKNLILDKTQLENNQQMPSEKLDY